MLLISKILTLLVVSISEAVFTNLKKLKISLYVYRLRTTQLKPNPPNQGNYICQFLKCH